MKIDSEILANKKLSMSSREIAELTGKRHYNVKRDTENMFKALELNVLTFECVYIGGNGEQRKMYVLPIRLVKTLILGYSAKLRLKVIDYIEYIECELSKRSANNELSTYPNLATYGAK